MKQLVSLMMVMGMVAGVKAQVKPYNYKLDGPFTSVRTIRVNGMCEISKLTIENKLKTTPGIYLANWDAGSKLLLVKYNRLLINTGKIEQLVAETGHDTQHVKASSHAYDALPEGCKYDRKNI
jgi:hypothetical protein